MSKRQQTAKRGRDVTVGPHGITKEAQLRWIALARLAQGASSKDSTANGCSATS